MANKEKLQGLSKKLEKLENSPLLIKTDSFLDEVLKTESEKFASSFKENLLAKHLQSFNAKLERFKKEFNLEPIIVAIEKVQSDIKTSKNQSIEEFNQSSQKHESKHNELLTLIKSTQKDLKQLTTKEVSGILVRIDQIQSELSYQSKDSNKKGQSLNEVVSQLESRIDDAFKGLKTQVMDRGDLTKSVNKRFLENKQLVAQTVVSINELRQDLMSRIASRGGSANQQINVNSSVMSTRYADFNIKDGSGVTITASDDDTNKRTDITFVSASGLSILAATGTINDSNKDFTFTSEPTLISINGVMYQKTGGAITWSFAGSTATLSSAVGTGGSIFGLT